jgi:hypothetical protein
VKRFLGRFAKDEPDRADDPQEDVTHLLDAYAARRYVADPVRPWMLVASRIGLWGAVCLGALGGLAGFLSGGDGEAEAAAPEAAPDPAVVPAQVASMAELVVEEWLTAERADEDRLVGLFVEPPELPERLDGRDIERVRTVAGQLVQPGYWSVTAAVDLVQDIEDPPPDAATGDAATGDEDGPEQLTWFVEVGIVGDPTTALAALRTPAIMPAPPSVEDGWSSTTQRWESPDGEDELAQTVDGFLNALLAGEGDPGRYLASGVEIAPVDPAPLDAVFVNELAVEELEDGRLRVQARVTGVVTEGQEQPLAYELVARWSDDRYEVLQLWGSSTLAGQPAPDASTETTTGAA